MSTHTQTHGWLLLALAVAGPLTLAGCHGSSRSVEMASPDVQTRPAPQVSQRPPSPSHLSHTLYSSNLPHLTNACIVVDAGHGGADPGAWEHTLSRLPEKTIALDIARNIASGLRQQGGKVVMTREDDRRVDLHDRAALAKQNRADLLVSIHANSAPSRDAVGTEIYVSRSASSRSEQIAHRLETTLRQAGIACRGMRRGDFVVLVDHPQPAILIECGFLTNRDDAGRLNDPAYRRRLALVIAEGILRALAAPGEAQLTALPSPAPAPAARNVISPVRRPLVP